MSVPTPPTNVEHPLALNTLVVVPMPVLDLTPLAELTRLPINLELERIPLDMTPFLSHEEKKFLLDPEMQKLVQKITELPLTKIEVKAYTQPNPTEHYHPGIPGQNNGFRFFGKAGNPAHNTAAEIVDNHTHLKTSSPS